MNNKGLLAFSVAWVSELRESPETVTRSLLCVTLGLLVALFVWYRWNRSRMEKMIEKIPGPPTWPLIGNAHLFLGLDMQGNIYRIARIIFFFFKIFCCRKVDQMVRTGRIP